jgi:hypothetical protein
MKKIIILLLVFSLSACSITPKSKFQYISNENSYLKLSHDWYTYNSTQFLRSQGEIEIDPTLVKIVSFVYKVDDVKSVLNATENLMGFNFKGDIPVDFTKENDKNAVITNLSEMLSLGQAKIIEDFKYSKYDGSHTAEKAVIDIPDANGNTYRISHKTIVDSDRKNIYVLILGCTIQCYNNNIKIINEINSTWKVSIK